jgi:hypothetical protein
MASCDPTFLDRKSTMTMGSFLKTSTLNKATTDLLVKYDKDGDGRTFSKGEVVIIVTDLQESTISNQSLVASNRLFKRLLAAGNRCLCADAGFHVWPELRRTLRRWPPTLR